jgi:DNA-binding MarR family transcriptional regulator
VNAIFFGAKRAFQAALRVTRPALVQLGLTAARFDMLTAIERYPLGPLQRRLSIDLGVTPPTVSRMLRSLQALGLVDRLRNCSDRRQWEVRLTPSGRALLRRATRILILNGAVQLAVDCALVGPARCCDESDCLTAMSNAESLFDRMRISYRDTANLHYRWHPDD